MLGPLRLTDDLAAKDKLLLAEEGEHRRRVDQVFAVAAGGGDDAPVARADRGAAGFLDAVAPTNRTHPTAHPRLGFQHLDIATGFFEAQGGGESGKASADHQHVAGPVGQAPSDRTHPAAELPVPTDSTPPSAGSRLSGRPERQQFSPQ